MAGCPLRNFEECPQHNKKGGCEWWMAYASNSGVTDAHMEGCAIVLGPLLQIEHANALGKVASEVRLGVSEMSAARNDGMKEGEALRKQLFLMANGNRVLVSPDYGSDAIQYGAPQNGKSVEPDGVFEEKAICG